eukprot:1159609-Pelagomonas_calceolata.AAC.1
MAEGPLRSQGVFGANTTTRSLAGSGNVNFQLLLGLLSRSCSGRCVLPAEYQLLGPCAQAGKSRGSVGEQGQWRELRRDERAVLQDYCRRFAVSLPDFPPTKGSD